MPKTKPPTTGRDIKKSLMGITKNPTEVLIKLVSSDIFLKLSFGWFILQAVFFAVTTRYGLPPDEVYHFTYIRLFAENTPSPFLTDQGHYDVLLEAVKNPFFFYHYLLSFPYLLVRGFTYAFVVLRIINVGLGLASLYLVYNIANQIKVSQLVRNLSIFMLSNTLMFVFLFGAISYDNLFTLLSLAAVLVLLKLLQIFTAKNFLWLIVIVLIGSLVKINFLPFAFMVLLVFLVNYYRQLLKLPSTFKKSFVADKKVNLLLCGLIALIGFVFVSKYVGNLITYRTIVPTCNQVRNIENCRRNSLFNRNEMLAARNTPANVGFLQYTTSWTTRTLDRTYGVSAHEHFNPNRFMATWSRLLLVMAGLFIVRNWQNQGKDRTMAVLLIISLFVALVTVFVNYQGYLETGKISIAIHGRYLFGVLPLLYLVVNYYIFKVLTSPHAKALYIGLTLIIFSISSWPTYLLKTDASWYTKEAQNINTSLQDFTD